MKKEIEKKVKELCDEAGSAAAQEVCGSLTRNLERGYDERIRAGMSELDAYRDVLRNVDEIKAMLDKLPKDDGKAPDSGKEKRRSARERKAEKKAKKSAESESGVGKEGKSGWHMSNRKMNSLCAALWILVTIVYFLGSFMTGRWELTWLIFLWGTIGQIIMNMVKKYNRGAPLGDTIRKGLTPIMWLVITIFYFIVSFGTGMWHLTWLVYLVGAIGQVLLSLVKKLQQGKPFKDSVRKSLYPILWLLVTIFYIIISFHTNGWALTWLIFLFGAFIQMVMDLILKD